MKCSITRLFVQVLVKGFPRMQRVNPCLTGRVFHPVLEVCYNMKLPQHFDISYRTKASYKHPFDISVC